MARARPLLQLVLLLALLLLSACGSREPAPPPRVAVDFAYQLEGEEHRLSELRGRPVVLVLMRVSEVVSEMYLYQVLDAYPRSAGEARYLVLTLEPSEEPLLGPYVAHHQLPFPIGIAEWSVASGESDLGLIPMVPTTVLIGPEGAIEAAFAGVMPAEDLVREIDRLGWR